MKDASFDRALPRFPLMVIVVGWAVPKTRRAVEESSSKIATASTRSSLLRPSLPSMRQTNTPSKLLPYPSSPPPTKHAKHARNHAQEVWAR